MGWPQVAYIILAAMSVGVVLAQHGRPVQREKMDAVPSLIRISVVGGLLYAGGFFA